MFRTIGEVLILLALGLSLGLGVNSLRQKHLELNKVYFRRPQPAPTLAPPAVQADEASTTPTKESPVEEVPPPKQDTEAHHSAKHEFQTITADDILTLLDDPLTQAGYHIFIDARNDEHFVKGHIPGAIQCDPYQSEETMPGVLDKAMNAEKVVVYCNGGDCEDSIYMCRELQSQGIAYEAIYLYEGGWKEWEKRKLPVETDQP